MEPDHIGEEIASAKAGHAGGFQALLDAYGPRLYGYFLRATGSHHDAEDLLSEMSLRLVRMLKSYDERGKFEPWLFRIAANLIRDRIRRIKANPSALSLFAEEESGSALADSIAGPHQNVDAGLEAHEASIDLSAALERLDETTRQMIVLRHFSQMSFKEIAGICQCPVGTVLARVHRGLRALRRLMGGEE